MLMPAPLPDIYQNLTARSSPLILFPMKKWLLRIGIFLLVLLVAFGIWVGWRLRDRHPGYTLRLNHPVGEPALMKVGFAAVSITPTDFEPWTDANEDALYKPEDGDSYEDRNGNGKFDAIWIAGFGKGRAAAGIHDSLWARTVVWDDGHLRVALVALDAVGFGHDDVIRVRQRVAVSTGVDYVIVASTHTHQAPDLIGLWAPGYFENGVNPNYLEQVIAGAAHSVKVAVEGMRPARLRFAQDLHGARPYVMDTRDPQIFDEGLYLMQALDAEADTTLGTLISWADHPETLWSDNLLLSSDFPHYLREGLEKGLYHHDSLRVPGLGGIAVYVNGCIGGLMTTHPSLEIPDPWRDTVYLTPDYEKARAQGEQLSLLALQALADSLVMEVSAVSLGLQVQTVELPLANPLYRLAALMGVLERGTSQWLKLRSEVGLLQIGPASMLLVPGEIYPEIVNGGVEAPAGQDFPMPPSETPPLRPMMPGTFQWVIGLANDELGYIIPQSQWDEEAPFTYGSDHAHYGEINSLGPRTAPILYEALQQVIRADSNLVP